MYLENLKMSHSVAGVYLLLISGILQGLPTSHAAGHLGGPGLPSPAHARPLLHCCLPLSASAAGPPDWSLNSEPLCLLSTIWNHIPMHVHPVHFFTSFLQAFPQRSPFRPP